MQNNTLNIGDNIRKLRELKNVTREQMASDVDMSLSGYSKIERNETDLAISKIQRIAHVLGVDISQILNFDASRIFNASNNNNMVQRTGGKADNINFYPDEYKDKYIKMLEEEIERLKGLLRVS